MHINKDTGGAYVKDKTLQNCDADTITEWVTDRDVFMNWGGWRFGLWPIAALSIKRQYSDNNGGCKEADNFYPWVAINDDNTVVGHYTLKYINGNNRNIHLNNVIIASEFRGRNYGKEMIELSLKYAFNFLDSEHVTLSVFEKNQIAINCYKGLGFVITGVSESRYDNIVEMMLTKMEYVDSRLKSLKLANTCMNMESCEEKIMEAKYIRDIG